MLNNFEDLIQLLGVGRKTVNVVLNVLFGELIVVVDIYIFCVVNCMGLVFGKILD